MLVAGLEEVAGMGWEPCLNNEGRPTRGELLHTSGRTVLILE